MADATQRSDLLPQHSKQIAAGTTDALIEAMRTPLACSLALSLLLTPCSAYACWDGVYASMGHVTLQQGENISWSVTDLENYALWLGRVNALLPPDGELAVEFGIAELDCGEGDVELTWNGSFPRLFHQVAAHCHATRAERAHAMSTITTLYTVQVGAVENEAGANRLADDINARELGAHGFIEIGGFPANNPAAHVIPDGETHRVWVGAFLDRTEAEAVATELGGGAYVRRLSGA